MSDQRIDQILKDPNQHPMKVIEGLLPEITRLRQLVQAQKRLIDLIETKNEYPFWWISAYRNKRKLKKILINIIKRLDQ